MQKCENEASARPIGRITYKNYLRTAEEVKKRAAGGVGYGALREERTHLSYGTNSTNIKSTVP